MGSPETPLTVPTLPDVQLGYVMMRVGQLLKGRTGTRELLRSAEPDSVISLVSEFDVATATVEAARSSFSPTRVPEMFANIRALDGIIAGNPLPFIGDKTCSSDTYAAVHTYNSTGLLRVLKGVANEMRRAEGGLAEPMLSFGTNETLSPANRLAAGAIQIAGRFITQIAGVDHLKVIEHPTLSHRTPVSNVVMDAWLEAAFLPEAPAALKNARYIQAARSLGWYAPSDAFHPSFTEMLA